MPLCCTARSDVPEGTLSSAQLAQRRTSRTVVSQPYRSDRRRNVPGPLLSSAVLWAVVNMRLVLCTNASGFIHRDQDGTVSQVALMRSSCEAVSAMGPSEVVNSTSNLGGTTPSETKVQYSNGMSGITVGVYSDSKAGETLENKP